MLKGFHASGGSKAGVPSLDVLHPSALSASFLPFSSQIHYWGKVCYGEERSRPLVLALATQHLLLEVLHSDLFLGRRHIFQGRSPPQVVSPGWPHAGEQWHSVQFLGDALTKRSLFNGLSGLLSERTCALRSLDLRSLSSKTMPAECQRLI